MLDGIVLKTKERLEEAKKNKSFNELKEEVASLDINLDFPFEKALASEGLSIIAEVKKASPSKGLIAEEFDYLAIAKEYETAGVSAISVLTEPYFFKGSNDYLKEIACEVDVPILRKDFTIDPYMIYEAKIIGASAVLLIVSILSDDELRYYLEIADLLGLSAIVETHDRKEIKRALDAGARIIGVNNRDLKNFTVNINNSIELCRLVPSDVLFISESGIKTKEDTLKLIENNIDAVLIGETLMKSDDKKSLIREFKHG